MDVKKRRYAKACDACHARKIRCSDFDGSSCQLCRTNKQACVFTRIEKATRKPARSRRQDIAALEDRLKDMEALLTRSHGGVPSREAEAVLHLHEQSPPGLFSRSQSKDRSPFDSESSLAVSAPSEVQSTTSYSPFPPEDQAMQLVESYLATCNTFQPIWNPITVRAKMHEAYPPNKQQDLVWHTSVLLILGFAHRLRAMESTIDADWHNKEASRYLGEVLDIAPAVAYGKPSLDTARVLLGANRNPLSTALVLYLLTLVVLGVASMLRATAMPDPARMFVSSAVRILQDLGAHEDPGEGAQSPLSSEIGRVFWTAYIHDKNLALGTGKPPILYEQDISRRPLTSSEWWLVTYSLDKSSHVNFFIAAYRLATIHGLIWSRLQSPNARRTPVDMLKVQAELNPLLAAWKADFPFEFKLEALQGRWPPTAILFMISLVFQYLQALLEVNRDLEGASCDPELMRYTFSTTPVAVEAARAALDFASIETKGNFAHVWLFFDYMVSAVLTLVVNLIRNPLNAGAQADVPKIEEWLQIIDAAAQLSERPDLLEQNRYLQKLKLRAVTTAQNAMCPAVSQQGDLDAPTPFPNPTTITDGTPYDGDFQLDMFPFDQWDWAREDEPALPLWRW